MQVSPSEIEIIILDHPDKLVDDVTVAGVSGGRTMDERLPRAWIVLSPTGVQLGAVETTKRIDTWVRECLSRYKWLRGGIEVVDEASAYSSDGPLADVFLQIPKSSTGKVLRRQLVEQYQAEHQIMMARL